jgi:hypothetical protein
VSLRVAYSGLQGIMRPSKPDASIRKVCNYETGFRRVAKGARDETQ